MCNIRSTLWRVFLMFLHLSFMFVAVQQLVCFANLRVTISTFPIYHSHNSLVYMIGLNVQYSIHMYAIVDCITYCNCKSVAKFGQYSLDAPFYSLKLAQRFNLTPFFIHFVMARCIGPSCFDKKLILAEWLIIKYMLGTSIEKQPVQSSAYLNCFQSSSL